MQQVKLAFGGNEKSIQTKLLNAIGHNIKAASFHILGLILWCVNEFAKIWLSGARVELSKYFLRIGSEPHYSFYRFVLYLIDIESEKIIKKLPNRKNLTKINSLKEIWNSYCSIQIRNFKLTKYKKKSQAELESRIFRKWKFQFVQFIVIFVENSYTNKFELMSFFLYIICIFVLKFVN